MPFATSIAPTWSRQFLKQIVDSLRTPPVAGPLTGAFLKLFSAVTGPISPDLGVGDFTEATFTGYAQVSIASVLGPTVNSPSGEGLMQQGDGDFVATAGVVSETILGYYVVDNTLAQVIMSELFLTPLGVNIPGDFISLDACFGLNFQNQIA